jgi:hypothetical protein
MRPAGPLLRMRDFVDGIKKPPHPEEAAGREGDG